MNVPEDLGALLQSAPELGADEQAFAFLTVDDGGFPHVALLSRRELELSSDRRRVFAVVGGSRTRANLERDGRAGLIAIDGSVAHYAKLRMARSFVDNDQLGAEFEIVEHKRDDIGVQLTPILFRTSAELARLEQWDVKERVMRRLERGSGSATAS